MVISQRLVHSTDGKRVALREYVVFTDQIVDIILAGGLENLTSSCRDVLRRFGRSFAQDARQKFKEGRISERTLKEIELGSEAEDKDADSELARQLEKAGTAQRVAERSHSSVESEKKIGVLSAQEMSHTSDPAQEPRFTFGSAADEPPFDPSNKKDDE